MIRTLQSLGLTLKEVKEYYYDTANIDKHLQRLHELRAMLDRNIQTLQVRAAKQGDLTVRKTTLPQQVCYCRRYLCADVAEAAIKLRNTYIAAARTGKMSMVARMFTMRMTSDPDKLDLLCCIPVDSSFDGPERTEFTETSALCIYYRGPYEGTSDATRALAAYIQEHKIETVSAPSAPFFWRARPTGARTAPMLHAEHEPTDRIAKTDLTGTGASQAMLPFPSIFSAFSISLDTASKSALGCNSPVTR